MDTLLLCLCAAIAVAVLVIGWRMERGDSDEVDAVFERVRVISDRPANDTCVFAEIARLRDEAALAQTVSADGTPLAPEHETTQRTQYEQPATVGRARKIRRVA